MIRRVAAAVVEMPKKVEVVVVEMPWCKTREWVVTASRRMATVVAVAVAKKEAVMAEIKTRVPAMLAVELLPRMVVVVVGRMVVGLGNRIARVEGIIRSLPMAMAMLMVGTMAMVQPVEARRKVVGAIQ